MNRIVAISLFALVSVEVIVAAPIVAEKSWEAKSTQDEPPAELAEKLRIELDKAAIQVVDPSGEIVLNLWMRSTIPVQATAIQIQNGVSYREIPEGTLLGTVKFPKAFRDTRNQEIAPGVYTLRYAIQPDIGDHAGTVPHPDFALLSPAEKDTSPETIEVKELLKRSRLATGGDHPGVMLLFPMNAKEKATKVAVKDEVFQVLQLQRMLSLENGEKTPLTMALTVHGHSKTR
jgi:hypothetical protein